MILARRDVPPYHHPGDRGQPAWRSSSSRGHPWVRAGCEQAPGQGFGSLKDAERCWWCRWASPWELGTHLRAASTGRAAQGHPAPHFYGADTHPRTHTTDGGGRESREGLGNQAQPQGHDPAPAPAPSHPARGSPARAPPPSEALVSCSHLPQTLPLRSKPPPCPLRAPPKPRGRPPGPTRAAPPKAPAALRGQPPSRAAAASSSRPRYSASSTASSIAAPAGLGAAPPAPGGGPRTGLGRAPEGAAGPGPPLGAPPPGAVLRRGRGRPGGDAGVGLGLLAKGGRI